MDKHIFTGKTKEEAIQKAIETLQELEIKVKEEQKGGLFKSSKVEIEVIEKRDIVKYIKDFIITTLKNAGYTVNVEVKSKEEVPTYTIYSDNDSLLIGKNGKNLSALSLIVKEHIIKETGHSYKFIIDVNDYKEKNNQRIERLARKLAREVKLTKDEVKLDPMNSYERRLIHNALTNNKYVTTESEGEEPNRYVVIKPIDHKEKSE